MIRHPYHCVACGTQLREAGMGTLRCPECGTGAIPSVDDAGNVTVHFTASPETIAKISENRPARPIVAPREDRTENEYLPYLRRYSTEELYLFSIWTRNRRALERERDRLIKIDWECEAIHMDNNPNSAQYRLWVCRIRKPREHVSEEEMEELRLWSRVYAGD